ncbi:MAG: hypothetical protein D6797_03570 [Bdellovibrio sp.]|nr:MAG: hypothetical protein D6797_03570 [Bdellovibrio sp.]
MEEKKAEILTSAKTYFQEMVDLAFEERQVKATSVVKVYLVDLLNFYLFSENLYPSEEREQTLAEQFLRAQIEDPKVRLEMLKKLGDTSLYISGFFGDSLKRKIVDIDYYASIGGSAYESLAAIVPKPSPNYEVFSQMAERFLDFVDILTWISQKSRIQKGHDILRLYERFIQTGSSWAKEQLEAQGIMSHPVDVLKKASEQ